MDKIFKVNKELQDRIEVGYAELEREQVNFGHFCFVYEREKGILEQEAEAIKSKLQELEARKSEVYTSVKARDAAFRAEYILIRSMVVPQSIDNRDNYTYDQKNNCFVLLTSKEENSKAKKDVKIDASE